MAPRTTKANSQPQSTWASFVTAIQQHFKPQRAEALQRIRLNCLCTVVLVIMASLLPTPSIIESITTVMDRGPRPERWTPEWVHRWICVAEVMSLAIFLYNIAESALALRYPPPPLPPTPSKQSKQIRPSQSSSATPKKAFKILSPNSSPQPQKPFNFSPSASFASSFASSSPGYPQSPISTPSRTRQYSTIPLGSTSTGSGFGASSTSTVGYSPSPSVSVYRGKGLGGSIGRAFDGSYLDRINKAEEEDEDE